MSHELSQCRQAGCTDAETELLRRAFVADLARAMQPRRVPVNRIRLALAATTAVTSTSTFTPWSLDQ
jgi:hypothetical protein